MSIVEIIDLVDSSVAIVVLLWVGYRAESMFKSILNMQQHIIDRLLNGDED